MVYTSNKYNLEELKDLRINKDIINSIKGIKLDDMKKVVNAPIPYAFDLTDVVIFKKDGRITHYEATPIEDRGEDDVWFHYEGDYLVVPKESARFFIRKNELGYYMLYHNSY